MSARYDEPDADAMWDAWFAQQKRNGMAVLSRDEWKQRLSDVQTDAYAEGRKDERDEWRPVLEALQRADTILRGMDPYGFYAARLGKEFAALIAKATGEQA